MSLSALEAVLTILLGVLPPVLVCIGAYFVYRSIRDGKKVAANAEVYRQQNIPNAYAFRIHYGEYSSDHTIEYIFEVVPEDSKTFIIDKVRLVAIESDLGPEATITWKYDRARIHKIRKPVLKPDEKPPLEFYGDLPMGITDRFEEIANHFVPAGAINPYTDKKAKNATEVPKNFTEARLRLVAERCPITIIDLKYNDRRPKETVPAPAPKPEDSVLLGTASPPPDPNPKAIDEYTTPYWEYPQPKAEALAAISYADRQTIHIMGQPDMGKSTLMRSMFRQDVASGKGVTLIDPHGDLATQALRSIPRSRWDDVIYFDPIRCPIGIDFLRYENDFERDAIADDLFAMFKHLTKGDGERMDAILKNAFPLLLRTPGATFLDLYRLVTDATYRDRVAGKVTDDELLKNFWRVQYPKFPPIAAEPLISRMQRFQANQALRTMFGTASDLDFYDVIRQRKILICNISAEYLRGETKDIIGALLVMKLHLAALKQAGVPEHKRALHYLYVDEFHTFKSSSFHEIITGDRKFGLRPTLANQYLDQLSPENYEAIRGAGFRVYFRLQDDDAPKLGRAVGGFAAADLLNLDKGEAILRPGKPSDTVKVKLPPPEEDHDDATEYVIARTRENFSSNNRLDEFAPPLPQDEEPGPSSPPPE